MVEKYVTIQPGNSQLLACVAQDRNPVTKLLSPVVVAVHVDDLDVGATPAQGNQFLEHEFAEMAAPATVNRELQVGRAQRRAAMAAGGSADRAMPSTVRRGTSPTAVTNWPSRMMV